MMTTTPPAFDSSMTTDGLTARPCFADWPRQLASNFAQRSETANLLAPGQLCGVRARILSAAHTYTHKLAQQAASAGLNVVSISTASAATCEAPLVATGHQPLIFHPGLLAKNRLLQQLLTDRGNAHPHPHPQQQHPQQHTDPSAAAQPPMTGLMIHIDTDEGTAGTIRFPQTQPQLQVSSRSLSTTSGLYLSQRILPEERVADLGQEIVAQLEMFGFTDAAERTSVVMDQYTRLAGHSAVAANAIVRRLWQTDATYLELPLSALCELPEVRQIFRQWITDAAGLHTTYNSTLQQFRLAHGIANTANPFPDLAGSGRHVELPFWVVTADGQSREPLIVNPAQPLASLSDDDLIVPRGMLISTVLRLLVSDLFIHGTGGERYDVCTEKFVLSWLGRELPPAVMATATHYLFSEEVRQIEAVSEQRKRVHNAQHRFGDHVEQRRFPIAWQAHAERLLADRTAAVDRLHEARASGRSAMNAHRQLKSIRRQIDRLAVAAFAEGCDLREPPPAEMKTLTERRFPFFFFDQSAARHETAPRGSCHPMG